MKSFGMQDSYTQINFDEVSLDDLEIISGGSGGGLTIMEGGMWLVGVGLCGAGTGVGVFAVGLGAVMIGGAALYGYYG